jgi:enolase
VAIALDPAASELVLDDGYRLVSEDRGLSSAELIDLWIDWADRYPIVSVEDGLGEEDWDGWTDLTARLGDRIQLVGDDLLVTSQARLARAIAERAANAVLVKVNQVGTLTEAMATVSSAQAAGWGTVMSHRSGETEDTTIADLAVALGTGQIKTGSMSRSERTAKYNRLLRIEEELGERAVYAGRAPFSRAG